MPNLEIARPKPACFRAGAGEPVLLLHSSASTGAQWRSLSTELADRFEVLAPDLYGHGGTDPWPGQAPFRLADEVELVETLMAGRRDPVHLVGHSYGGAVALRLAFQAPERLRSLTLIEPVAFHLLRQGGVAEQALHAEVVALAHAVAVGLAGGAYWSAMERFVDYWNGRGAFARMPVEKCRELSRCLGAAALNFAATLAEPTPLGAYRRIRVPTLLLAGAASAPTTLRIAHLLASALPDVRFKTIAGAKHMLPLTHRAAVHEAIVAHLSRQPGSLEAAA